MFRYSTFVPLSIVNGSEDTDTIEVSFDYAAAEVPNGVDPPEGEQFCVVFPSLLGDADERVVEWLAANWTPPAGIDDLPPDPGPEPEDARPLVEPSTTPPRWQR